MAGPPLGVLGSSSAVLAPFEGVSGAAPSAAFRLRPLGVDGSFSGSFSAMATFLTPAFFLAVSDAFSEVFLAGLAFLICWPSFGGWGEIVHLRLGPKLLKSDQYFPDNPVSLPETVTIYSSSPSLTICPASLTWGETTEMDLRFPRAGVFLGVVVVVD